MMPGDPVQRRRRPEFRMVFVRVAALCAAAVCSIAVLSFSTPAAAIEGNYALEGQNPGDKRSYKGEAQVKQTGRTYSVIWKVGQAPQFGTGILIDKTFSVVFQSFVPGSGPGRPGIAVFTIENNRIAQGVWTAIGQQETGIEIWTATDRP